MMLKKIFISILLIWLLSQTCLADTIILKSGRKVEGKIIEKTDKYIKIDFYGVPLTYSLDEIVNTDGTLVKKEPREIFQSVAPAVVYITTQEEITAVSQGSGFIVDSEGLIITNFHVATGKEISIRLKDGVTYPVISVINYDAKRDICILKIGAKNLPTVPLGNSDNLIIGEKIYAIGNPHGLEYTFSDGLISGVRNTDNIKILQFTAPISGGNSGGPLLNTHGEVIGIVSATMPVGQNLNFAFAINEVKPLLAKNLEMPFKEFSEKIGQPLYYVDQGGRALLEGNLNSARDYCQKALDINPNFGRAYSCLGSLYGQLGQDQQAISYLQKAIQLGPNDEDSYNNMASLYQDLKQHRQAIYYAEKSIQLKPNSAAYGNLAAAYIDLGQPQQAIPYLQKAVELDPQNSSAYNNFGAAYIRLGQYQEAVSFFRKSIQLDPSAIDVYVNLGEAYNYLGQYRNAIDVFSQVKALCKQNGDNQCVQFMDERLNRISGSVN